MHLQCYIVPPDNFPSYLPNGRSIRNQYFGTGYSYAKQKNFQKKSQIKINT